MSEESKEVSHLNHPLKHVGKRQVRDGHILPLDHNRTLGGNEKKEMSKAQRRHKVQAAAYGEALQAIKHAAFFNSSKKSCFFTQGQLVKVPRSDRDNQTLY